MKLRFFGLIMAIFIVLVCTGCGSLPARAATDSPVKRPTQVTDFTVLYGENCAGCHGSYGKGGAAIPLSDPLFLKIADDATIRRTAEDGVPGTPMPAFAQSAGGMLTDEQIDAIVSGIRSAGRNPICFARLIRRPIERRLPAIRFTAPQCTQHTAHPVMAQMAGEARRPARLSMARTLPWSAIKTCEPM